MLAGKSLGGKFFSHQFAAAQKLKKWFSINDFFSKCDQIHGFLRVWSHLLKKSLMENFIFCAVYPWLNEVFFKNKVASLEKNCIQDSINIMYCKVLLKQLWAQFLFQCHFKRFDNYYISNFNHTNFGKTRSWHRCST